MLPSGWKKHNLSEVVKVIDCKHRTPEYVESGIPLISPGTIKWGSLDTESPNKRVSFSEYQSLMDHCSIDIDDLVMSRNQSVGVVSYVSSLAPFVLGQDTVLLKPEQAQGKYIFYKLQSESVQKLIAKLAGGSTFSRINLSDIKKIKIDIPPLPEQKKIAQILSTWDKAITTTEQLIANSQQQKKALMQQLLTGKKRLLDDNGVRFGGEWIKKKISDIGNVITGSTPPKNDDSNYGGSISWATAEDFKNKYITSTKIRLSQSGAGKSRIVPAGSVLITCIASIGKNAIAKEPMATNQQINSVIVNEKHCNEFFYYLIEFNNDLLLSYAGTTAVPIINKSTFEKIAFHFPNYLTEQQKIASVLSSADQEIELLQTKLTALKQEKKALMQQLLTGKRRVKVG